MGEPQVDEAHDPGARVRALCNVGSSVDIDANIPAKRYFRSGLEIIRMANVYYDEGELESAFILYSKFISLFVEKLPKHPGYKDKALHQDKIKNRKKLEDVFPKAEEVKKRLRKRYEQQLEVWLEHERERLAAIAREEELERQRQEEEWKKLEEERKKKEETDRERRDYEFAKALQEEESFLESEKEKYRQLELKKQEELKKQQELEKAKELAKQADQLSVNDQDRNAAGIAAGIGTAGVSSVGIGGALPNVSATVSPGLPAARPATAPPMGGFNAYNAVSPSVINAYSPNFMSTDVKPLPTPLPPIGTSSTKGILKDSSYSNDTTIVPQQPPPVDRSLKVDRSTKPTIVPEITNTTTNQYGLRHVVVPQDLMVKFLNLAMPNTNRNVETCAILAGKLAQNAFQITHVIVPKQSGTSDSCTTLNEEDIFDYQDNHDLITLGWIHTHPSQTAFLSSVDLHTHCSYQLMMPEAIAIVCAPKHKETGIFMLTPGHGLDLIASCRETGFHPHPKHPPLFEECGHVTLTNSKSVIVADLRH
ncbi:STAM-binding protein-like [Ptychodera flava]|uniref:STAM-binding protein-like n=1 Tax=Ptychodera flava TaxID=63121 RepID=UPI003969E37D